MHLSSLGATWENSLGNSLSQILLLLNKSLHVSLILSSCFIMQFVSALNCHCVWNMLYKYIALPVGYIANNDFLSFCQFPTFFFLQYGNIYLGYAHCTRFDSRAQTLSVFSPAYLECFSLLRLDKTSWVSCFPVLNFSISQIMTGIKNKTKNKTKRKVKGQT